jgi:hypothetical protein
MQSRKVKAHMENIKPETFMAVKREQNWPRLEVGRPVSKINHYMAITPNPDL